jgi:hypothetical protein
VKKGVFMAAVVFESIIRSNPVGKWYIELIDTSEEDRREFCLDIDEYAQKIEDMGAEYGGDIEVVWKADENVTEQQLNEVRMQMAKYQQEMEKDGTLDI